MKYVPKMYGGGKKCEMAQINTLNVLPVLSLAVLQKAPKVYALRFVSLKL